MSDGLQNESGTVVSLWRYPVKSMMGEELNASLVTERGLVGDRAYALVDAADGKVASAKNPRKWPRLFEFRASFAEPSSEVRPIPPVRITLPDGMDLSSDRSDLDQILSTALSREVRLKSAAPQTPVLEEYWRGVRSPTRSDMGCVEARDPRSCLNASRSHLMSKITRRSFVGRSIESATALAAGTSALTAARPATAASANEKVVLGLIGAGGRGRTVIGNMLSQENVEVKFVCDVEQARGRHAAAEIENVQGARPRVVNEMRQVFDDQDVDGVVIATPEHWHALATIWACQAGKDVYVEKSISASIWEGRKMVEAARKYKRIVQAGTQTRSAPYMSAARDYIKEGGLGDVLYVKVFGMYSFVYGGYPRKPEPDSDPPPGLDWDRWLGPAPEQPYNQRLHRQWYGYWRFSGGNASDAIHTLDAARMVLGDPPHPKSVQCVGGRWKFDDDGVMPDVEIVTYGFDRMALSFDCTGFTEQYMFKTPMSIRQSDRFPFWPLNTSRIEIYGTKRMMYLGRVGGGWQVLETGPQELDAGFGKVAAQQYGRFPDEPHAANFIDCIRTRKTPNADVEQGHRSACLEHLANLSYRLGGAKLIFDGRTETFVGNEEANGHLKPPYRKHYQVPEDV